MSVFFQQERYVATLMSLQRWCEQKKSLKMCLYAREGGICCMFVLCIEYRESSENSSLKKLFMSLCISMCMCTYM